MAGKFDSTFHQASLSSIRQLWTEAKLEVDRTWARCPWWHRLLGTVVAVAFFAGHLIGHHQ